MGWPSPRALVRQSCSRRRLRYGCYSGPEPGPWRMPLPADRERCESRCLSAESDIADDLRCGSRLVGAAADDRRGGAEKRCGGDEYGPWPRPMPYVATATAAMLP